MHETHEAARAVAALLHLAAVGIEDPVVEVRALEPRPLDDQDLVAADTQVAVGEALPRRRVEGDGLAGGVDHDEVVAGAVHLGECQLHRIKCT